MTRLSTTEFSNEDIQRLLEGNAEFEDWVVGEAIAEAFVTEHHDCEYPWPTSRDLKNSSASPAGCDLTGFQLTDDTENCYRFSFGEVKTSSQAKSPPSVMTSLGSQLFGLRDSRETKTDLMCYLGFHANGKSWFDKFQSAARRYLSSECTDIAIFGILIRDTPANDSDIKGRAGALADDCPEFTDITLIALYLPNGTISTLPEKVQSAINSGGES